MGLPWVKLAHGYTRTPRNQMLIPGQNNADQNNADVIKKQ
jgi:hypothetical protein